MNKIMNKETFFKILTYEIKGLPNDEQQNALDYYTEYFNDCENEVLALEKLLHPREIAQNLYNELGIEKKPARYYSPLAIIGIVVLAILFGPLGFGLLVATFSLVVIVPASFALATAFTSLASIIVVIPAGFANSANILSFFGLGILSFGACMLFYKVTIYTFVFFVSVYKKIGTILQV